MTRYTWENPAKTYYFGDEFVDKNNVSWVYVYNDIENGWVCRGTPFKETNNDYDILPPVSCNFGDTWVGKDGFVWKVVGGADKNKYWLKTSEQWKYVETEDYDILPQAYTFDEGTYYTDKFGNVWECCLDFDKDESCKYWVNTGMKANKYTFTDSKNKLWHVRTKPVNQDKIKPQLSRLSDFNDALSDVCDVLAHGEKKHGDNKDYLKYDKELDIDAALRHIMRHKGNDDETGKLHVIHAICRLLFYYNKAHEIK